MTSARGPRAAALCRALAGFAVLACCLVGFAPQVAARDRPVFVVVTDVWPPFRFENRNGDMAGIDPELMDLVGEKLGVTFVFKRMPWARCLEAMRAGEADAMTGLAKTAEREAFIAYVDAPYLACAPRFYAASGVGAGIRGYGDLRGKRIGFARQSAYFEPFDSDTTLLKVPATTESQIIDMALAGRVDLFVGTDCQVEFDLLSRGLADRFEQTRYKPEGRTSLYVGVSRKSPLMHHMNALKKALAELIRQGVPQELAARHGLQR